MGKEISLNWTTQEQILPISLETFEISPNLINVPKTLRDLAVKYRNKKNILNKKDQNSDKPEDNSKFQTFLNSIYYVDFSFCFNYPIMTQGLFSLITEPNIDLNHKLSPRSPTMAFSSVRENVTPTLS